MKMLVRRVVLAVILAFGLAMGLAQPLEALWCEILRLSDMSCVICHRWIKIGSETCDLWEGWCSDGWYDNGWFCWGNL